MQMINQNRSRGLLGQTLVVWISFTYFSSNRNNLDVPNPHPPTHTLCPTTWNLFRVVWMIRTEIIVLFYRYLTSYIIQLPEVMLTISWVSWCDLSSKCNSCTTHIILFRVHILSNSLYIPWNYFFCFWSLHRGKAKFV